MGRIGPHRLHKLKKAGSNPATATMLFKRGTYTFASGQQSAFKIECDGLDDEDWATLAMLLVAKVPPFNEVHGVPRGGLPLAEALHPYLSNEGVALVVDDVWTTGGSMRKYIDQTYLDLKVMHRAVVFAHNPPPPDVTALFLRL